MSYVYYSKAGEQKSSLGIYLLSHLKPEAGSEFANKLERLPPMPPRQLFQQLEAQGYDALVRMEERPLGFFAFQRHPHWWGVFRVFVEKEHQRKGIATAMLGQLVDDAFSEGMAHIMIGGHNEDTRKVQCAFTRAYNGRHRLLVDASTGLIARLKK